MAQDLQDKRTFRIGLAVMLVLVLVLALRSQRTVSAVLAKPAAAAVTTAGGEIGVDMASLARRDSLIVAAQLVARDPFNARRTRPTAQVQQREVAVTAAPSLSALLFDHVNPSTQINVEGQRSGWLHQGETFQGWTVAAITSDAVTITRGGETIVLP